jgi:membrane-associated protease RseP (regulator of RpoE activity)
LHSSAFKGIGLNLEMVWLFLLLLGLTLYFIVQYSVVRVTRTPWWQLWLVLMIPAFVIAGWSLTHKSIEAIPTPLLVGTFLVSTVLYIFLIGRNPRPLPEQSTEPQNNAKAQEPVSPLNNDEQAQLKNCFPWSVYYLKQIDLRPQAVICRGQLRAESEMAYQTIRQNVQTQFGDRFLVLFQAGAADQTYFALVANPYSKAEKPKGRVAQKSLKRPGLALGLLALTVFTTTLAGIELTHPALQPRALLQNPQILLSGLPYSLCLMAILGIHELGHYFTAQFYKILTTLPYFIPIPFAFGTFGAYIQMRTPAPNRKALFDVGIAGPLAGFIITVPILVWGLMHSDLTALPEKLGAMSPSAFNPRFSIFFAGVSRLIFGSALTDRLAIHLHPVAIAGWLGLIVTALNLMPFGQLDGGHIVHAMYGQRVGILIGQVCRVLVLLLSFAQPFLLFWGILLLFMPAVDEPALNDVSELDSYRDTFGLLALGLLLLIVLPVPSGLESFFFTIKPTP